MYKLVLYGLTILSVMAIVFGFVGILPYSGLSMIALLLEVLFVCFLSNTLFAKILKVQTNVESAWISAYILFFVLAPVTSLNDLLSVALVGFLAMASKYILAINKKHIFNPVAIAIFLVGLFGSGIAIWWVATISMIAPVTVLGFLVARKIRRTHMVLTFLVASLVSIFVFNYSSGMNILELLKITFISGPIVFFGTIMLTEPLTTPPGRKFQVIYAVIVGLLFGAQFEFWRIYSTPGLALICGNLFSYFVSPRFRSTLTLKDKKSLTKDIYEFFFKSDVKIDYKAGQYLEWTLGHDNPDQRGNRRYFTISSSPTEEDIKLGIKFYDNSSSFKKKLLGMNIGETISASQLSGEFVMPENKDKKLVFIAGGIGVTPFRSMIKNLIDTDEKRDIVMFFSNRTPADIVYKDIFDEAKEKIGLKTIYAVNDLAGSEPLPDMRVGFINEEMIRKEVPDFAERVFYISGPHVMVSAFETTLNKMGIKSRDIKVDFFPGFV